MKPPVFVASWAPDDVLADLRASFEVEHVDIHETGLLPRDEFAARLAGKAGLLVLLARVDADMMAANAGTLKVVANCAVGTDNIDVAAATANRILVTNTPGVLTESVADMSMGMVIAVGRRLAEADRYTRAGKFQGPNFQLFWGAEINGETLGIVGFGRIGQAFARRAKGFGMKLLYHTRNRVEAAIERELGARWRPLDDLLAEARFTVLLTPLTDETHHLIDARRLALMRKDGYLVNMSRGPVVHEQALVDALREKRIAGAALDVYEFEPKLTEGLADFENVVLTPHIASGSVETRHGMVRLAAANLKAALTGPPAPNPVNEIG